jgi:hypothetical protein
VLTAHPGSGSPIAFTGSGSLDPDGSIRSYSWRFGDGSSIGSGSHARHTYARPGTYAVTLTVVDSSGFSTAVTHKIIVPRPGKVTRVYTTKNSKGTFLMINLNGPGTLTINGQRLRIRKAYTAKVNLIKR